MSLVREKTSLEILCPTLNTAAVIRSSIRDKSNKLTENLFQVTPGQVNPGKTAVRSARVEFFSHLCRLSKTYLEAKLSKLVP